MYQYMSSGGAKTFGLPLLALVLCMCARGVCRSTDALDSCRSTDALDSCQSTCTDACLCTCANATNNSFKGKFFSLSPESLADLEAPCPVHTISPYATFTVERIMETRNESLQYIKLWTSHLQELVDKMLDKNAFIGCRQFTFQREPKTLPADYLDKPMNEIYQLILAVQMNYTAHWYFLVEQIQRYSYLNCKYDAGLIFSATQVIAKMRSMLCYMQMFMTATHGFDASFVPRITEQITSQVFQAQPMCIRKIHWHCGFMHSTLLALNDIERYFNPIDIRPQYCTRYCQVPRYYW